jgi:2-polyprenyl-6-methoxyphenol hydroxylase-like FAD-dependent oxidoreductase
MTQVFDAIIVGARCAGSPTAMLLARKGYRVLLVDRATFPSDMVSTHIVHPLGIQALSRWGLLARLVATGCPPIDTAAPDRSHARQPAGDERLRARECRNTVACHVLRA